MAFDFTKLMMNPQFQLGMGMLGASGPGTSFADTARGGLMGMQNYQASQYQQARMDELKRKREEEDRARQAKDKVLEMHPELGALLEAYPNAAPSILSAQFKAPAEAPANVREWQYYITLTPQEQNQYLEMKRATKWLNQGDQWTPAPQSPSMPFVQGPRPDLAIPGANVPPVRTAPMPGTGAIPIRPSPEQRPDFKAAQTEATEQARQEVTRQFDRAAARPKAQNALNTYRRQTRVAKQNIDDIIGLYDPLIPWTPEFFARFPTRLRAIQNKLNTIKGNIGFQALQEMRTNSPTGGALGQVAVQELENLQGILGTLDPKDPEFIPTLLRVQQLLTEMEQSAMGAFQTDFGDTAPSARSQPTEPKRRRWNPDTGAFEDAGS